MIDDFVIGGIYFSWFKIIIVFTVIISATFMVLINKYDNYPMFVKQPVRNIIIYVLVCSSLFFLGSRIMAHYEFVIMNEHNNITVMQSILYNRSGASWLGGFLLTGLYLIIFTSIRVNKQNRKAILNYSAIIFCLVYSIGRQACFLTADGCYGIPTNHPFGMRFLHGIKPTLLTVHPTPLYESIIHLLILFLLIKIRKSNYYFPVAVFLILTGLSRFFIEYIRRNPEIIFNLTMAQLISIVIFLMGSILFINQMNLKLNRYEN